MLIRSLRTLTDLIFPMSCECCDACLPFGSFGICAVCASKIPAIRAPYCRCGRSFQTHCLCKPETFHFDRAFACFYYEGKIKQALHAYKYGSRKSLKNFFTPHLSRLAEQEFRGKDFEAVVSIPISSGKKISRGYNQSQLFSQAVARHLRLPDLSGNIERLESVSAQALLARQDRARNVQGRFRVTSDRFKGKNILLVDDILTTGHTASECARALKESLARSVSVLVLARGR